MHRESGETHWLNGALRDRTEKYIDGEDLARLFREKLKPTTKREGRDIVLEENSYLEESPSKRGKERVLAVTESGEGHG